MAPTMTEVSQRATMAPPAYVMTVVLFSTASHCHSQQHARLLNFKPFYYHPNFLPIYVI